MPANSANLQRPFHKAVYDRNLGRSLQALWGAARDQFVDASGAPLRVHGEGRQTRCYTHVLDVAEGIRAALETPDFAGVLNVADQRECSVRELAAIALQALARGAQVRREVSELLELERELSEELSNSLSFMAVDEMMADG